MNKAQLIDAMAAETQMTKVQTKKALEAFMTVIGKSLKKGDRIGLVGFGSFSVGKRAARKGINPKDQTVIKIPAKKVVKFKAGQALASKVK